MLWYAMLFGICYKLFATAPFFSNDRHYCSYKLETLTVQELTF